MISNYFKTTAVLLLFLLPFVARGEAREIQRELVLSYLETIGVIESIDLQVETMRVEYLDYYSFLPNSFWDEPPVEELFDGYKVALLRGYVEAMEDELSVEELKFLIEFYDSENGQKAIAFSRRLNPLMVAAASEAGRDFTSAFAVLVDGDAE